MYYSIIFITGVVSFLITSFSSRVTPSLVVVFGRLTSLEQIAGHYRCSYGFAAEE